jgi:hypothetical protein
MRLDEAALRRPEWTEGVSVVLCDGQTWHLPRPELGDFYFVRGDDGKTVARRGSTFGADYEALLDLYMDAETGADQAVALYDLAVALLARNYDLPADLRTILRVVPSGSPGRDDNEAMWETIAEAALGRVPKATPVG